jgi:Mn2+/Fe2+ NRAMP family transporter
MLLLINKKELMGEYVNSYFFNAIAWGTTIIVAGLSVALAIGFVTGKAGG